MKNSTEPKYPDVAIVASAWNIPDQDIRAWTDHPVHRLARVIINLDIHRRPYSPALEANILIRKAIDSGARVIIKTDIDCRLCPSIVSYSHHNQAPDTMIVPFICEYSEAGPHILPYHGPSGTIAAAAETWEKLHGFDERMYGHGREDGELVTRARQAGMVIQRCATGFVTHIPHPPRAGSPDYPRRRFANQDIIDQFGPWPADTTTWGLPPKGEAKP